MKRTLTYLLLAFVWLPLAGQLAHLPVTLHSRVDTFDVQVKEIASLYIGYLNSRPDSIYDNPFWNQAEKKLYDDFDHTRRYLYPIPAPQLLSYYRPTVLSIVPFGEYYAIRTLFSADLTEESYRNGNPWCITRIFAVKEQGQWKLMNALPVITESWERKTLGKITFAYPPTHPFNDSLAQQSADFFDKMQERFQLPDWEPFTYYITGSMDEMGTLEGFDFYYPGSTTGKVLPEYHILLSGHGSEWYPHEFGHILAPKGNRHQLINEGFATLMGGTNGCSTLDECAQKLAQDLKESPQTSLLDIISHQWRREYSTFYTLGGLLCQYVYVKKGIPALHALLAVPADDAALHAHLAELFGMSELAWDKFMHMGIGAHLD